MTATVTQAKHIYSAPKNADETAVHYGYVAYRPIGLVVSGSREYWVQPEGSPYITELPNKQMIPFTNMEVAELDEELAAQLKGPAASIRPLKRRHRSALECAKEIESAYENWAFVILDALTGVHEDDAFHVFQTVQPFTYRLRDLPEQLEWDAVERIAQTEPYEVAYEDMKVMLQPLPAEYKAIAEKVRERMLFSARRAQLLASERKAKTEQGMTQFFATGKGKAVADPLDKAVFDEMGEEIPRFTRRPENSNNETGLLSQLVDLLSKREAAPTPPPQTSEADELARLRAQVAALQAEREAQATPTAKTVNVGDTIIVDGQEATVTAKKPFGRVQVTLSDGTTQTINKPQE